MTYSAKLLDSTGLVLLHLDRLLDIEGVGSQQASLKLILFACFLLTYYSYKKSRHLGSSERASLF